MSFSFYKAGTPAQVRAELAADDSFAYGDTSQLDAVKAFISAELAAWPEPGYYNGVVVEASGHHDASSRNLSISMRPVKLAEAAETADTPG